MTIRPTRFIGQFIENIRKMVSGDMPASQMFKQLIMAFEQVNHERLLIINNQGKIIEHIASEVATKNAQRGGMQTFLAKVLNGIQ